MITIAAIYGHSDGSEAIPAIQATMEQIPNTVGLILSLRRPDLPVGIEWKKIGFMNYNQYSIFVMHSLYSFINTEHCLLVQDDGWCINGLNINRFLEYDYVGAPCHLAFIDKSENNERPYRHEVIAKFGWVNEPRRTVIQNGGFSLRSRRLLEAPNKYGFTHTGSPQFWKEDIQLTGIYRKLLEAKGIRFAPEDVAKTFAIEHYDPSFHKNVNLDQIIGLHRTNRKLVGRKLIQVKKSNTFSAHEHVMREHLEKIGYSLVD